ncbi:MAG: hypothetical protein ACR2PH_03225 [Desulfobulbia bacterium]
MTEEGAEIAEEHYDEMEKLVSKIGDAQLANILLTEASYRLFRLPNLTSAEQEKYRKGNKL